MELCAFHYASPPLLAHPANFNYLYRDFSNRYRSSRCALRRMKYASHTQNIPRRFHRETGDFFPACVYVALSNANNNATNVTRFELITRNNSHHRKGDTYAKSLFDIMYVIELHFVSITYLECRNRVENPRGTDAFHVSRHFERKVPNKFPILISRALSWPMGSTRHREFFLKRTNPRTILLLASLSLPFSLVPPASRRLSHFPQLRRPTLSSLPSYLSFLAQYIHVRPRGELRLFQETKFSSVAPGVARNVDYYYFAHPGNRN